MPSYETDAILHCDHCGDALYRVERVPTEHEGVFTHRTVAVKPNLPPRPGACPGCGGGLARKPT